MQGQDLDHNSGSVGPMSSSPSSSFTPINPLGRLIFRSSEDTPSNQENPSFQQNGIDNKDRIQRIEPQTGLPVPRIQKRGFNSDDSERPAKRPRCPPATPSSSPFRNFKVTKPDFSPIDSRVAREYGEKQCTVQTTMDSSIASSRHLLPETTMDRLTPRSTRPSPGHESNLAIGEEGHEETVLPDQKGHSSHKSMHTVAPGLIHPNTIGGGPPPILGARCSDTFMQNDSVIDEYALDESEEEEMIRLMNETNPCVESHMPPSSLADGWDRDSRDADEYDPNLQHSSLPSSSTGSNPQDHLTKNDDPPIHPKEDFLDDDVDWDAVFAITSSIPKDPSLVGAREVVQLQTTHTKTEASCIVDGEIPLAPFVRPEFPDKVRDRSPVPGLSSRTVLRTCFRIGEMISQASRCFHQQQGVIFELYARVTYSSRELLTRKQHFQFVDLFKDQQLYPSGTLTGWRIGSLLDRQSQVFVSTSSPKLCWCLCKPKRNPQASTHWTFEIVGIRETNWAQIRYAKMVLCGGKEGKGEEVPLQHRESEGENMKLGQN